MTYFENDLIFTSAETTGRTRRKNPVIESIDSRHDLLGIKLRIGNQPLVYNLKELVRERHSRQPGLFVNDPDKDVFLVMHAMGAIRTQGRARVEELQYFAETSGHAPVQTVDLLPNTRFREVLRAGVELEVALSSFGELSTELSPDFLKSLMPLQVPLGGMRLQLSSSAAFIGKFSFSVRTPVVQSMGIGSDSCSWILSPAPDSQPLLGDQLLIQTIAVPQGTKKIMYRLSGLVKADKGLLWKQQQLRTPEYMVQVSLNVPDRK